MGDKILTGYLECLKEVQMMTYKGKKTQKQTCFAWLLLLFVFTE